MFDWQNTIPNDWKLLSLGEATESIEDTDHNIPRKVPNGVPFISAKNISSDGTINFEDLTYISQKDYEKLSLKVKPEIGDILYTRIGARLGKAAIVEDNAPHKFQVLHSCCIIKVNPEKVNRYFLKYLLNSHLVHKQAKISTQSIGVPDLGLGKIKKFKVPLPPINEQKKIADLLVQVDFCLSKIEKVTKASRRVKKSLSQILLTRGIGHTRFKQTKIGEIPESWAIQNLQDCSDILDSKRIPLNQETRRGMQGKIPYYGANGVVDYINDYIFDEELILIAEDGGNFNDFSTKSIAYLVSGKCWVNNHAHVLRAKQGYLREWIFYNLEHRDLRAFVKGGTRLKLNQSDLKRIPIPIPPQQEQEEIVSILLAADMAINNEKKQRESLYNLKKGLMQALLSGIVRVPV